MKTITTRTLAALAVIVATFAGGCAARQPMARRSYGDLALSVPVGTTDGAVDVIVTGSDMPRPVYGQLRVEDGIASGTVYDIEAGPNRRVFISAHTLDGRRCATELDARVAPHDVTTVDEVSMRCEAHSADTVAATRRPPSDG